ncbi:hypothetical protein VTK73DRAFT_2922 [Phialemonium thermophilum]|uniref:Uncharacterized protein n=1 Tax=Phialemonium thermophilum TaxID=223376 RepID=A0ABR3X2C8_9PEZI
MKLFTSVGLLVGFVVAESLDVACPTVTQQILNPSCRKRCNSADCTFVTTVQNPCGCPATVPTATLLAPCEAGCPYDGCAVEFRSIQQSCTPTSSHWTRRCVLKSWKLSHCELQDAKVPAQALPPRPFYTTSARPLFFEQLPEHLQPNVQN